MDSAAILAFASIVQPQSYNKNTMKIIDKIKFLFITVPLLLSLTHCVAIPEDSREGDVYIKVFDEALSKINAEDSGNSGYKIICDREKIIEMRKRAESGDISAYISLADFYLEKSYYKDSDSPDKMKAVEILKYVADRPSDGNFEIARASKIAAKMLGDMFSGNSINYHYFKRDFKEAEIWYSKLLSLGDESARLYLSYVYSNDENPNKNLDTAKKYIFPLIDKEGYDIAKFEYDSLCAKQNNPAPSKEGREAFFDNSGNIDYESLIKAVKEGNFEAQIYLARVYLGDTKFPIQLPKWVMEDYDSDKVLKITKKLGVKREICEERAHKLLRDAALMGNPKGAVMYALMLINGIATDKNIELARGILLKFSPNSAEARFCYELYFSDLNLKKINLSHLAGGLHKMKDTPYTFNPNESYEWSKMVKCPPNEYITGEYFRLEDPNLSLRDIPKGQKKLMPLQAVIRLVGLLSESGDNTYVIDPSQVDAFFEEGNVYISGRMVWKNPNIDTTESGPFESYSYELVGELEGGVQVLSIYRNDGGSLAQSYIYFVAMRDIEVLDGEETIKVLALQNLGKITEFSDIRLMKMASNGNVFILYRIVADDRNYELYSNSVKIISFEKGAKAESESISALMEEMFGFRKETCPWR